MGGDIGVTICRATYEGIHVHPFDIDSCTLTLTADRPRHTANCSTALPKVSSRVYVCTNASELITTQQESSGLHKSWSTQSLMHVHIATGDLETLHPGTTACVSLRRFGW